MTSTYDVRLDAARIAVLDASHVCRLVQRRLDEVRAITKDDRSPVTIADYASQAIVAHLLTERLGEPFVLVGEEGSEFLRSDEHALHRQATLEAVREVWPECDEAMLLDAIDIGAADPPADGEAFWTLDPIDGTKGFLRGQQYCVSLGYVERGTPTIGLLGCPNLPLDQEAALDLADPSGTLYAAIKDVGCFEAPLTEGGELSRIAIMPRPEGAPVRACESVESAHSNQSVSAQILARLGPAGEPARVDSQCKYAIVARGQADTYLRLPTRKGYVERIWDHAAGSLVATEAGVYRDRYPREAARFRARARP